jgi:hypothetical protein
MFEHNSFTRHTRTLSYSLFLILLIFSLTMEVAKAKNPTPPQDPDAPGTPAQGKKIFLEGKFSTLWGDSIPSLGKKTTSFLLFDNQGNTIELLLEEDILKRSGGPLALNRKQVAIVGETAGKKVKVKEIKLKNKKTKEENGAVTPLDNTGAVNSVVEATPVIGSRPWISILCKFADVVYEPKPLSYFEDLFSNTYPGLDHYWREVSYNAVNLEGSNAVGWYTLPNPRSYYVYDTDGDGIDDLDWGRAADDCTAVADHDVYFPDYTGINLMFNATLDCCAWGIPGWFMRLDGVDRFWGMTWEPPWGYEHQQILAHETGHGFNIPHADTGNWDGISVCSPPDPTFGCIANDRISHHLDRNGWTPASRKYVASPGSSQTIWIERLDLPAASTDYLMAEIPIAGSTTQFYTVETRKFAGYDNQIPGEAIIIHKVDTTNGVPAKIIDYDGNGNQNDAGVMWLPGETFTDGGISVSVLSESETGFSVEITNEFNTIAGYVRSENGDAVPNASVAILDSNFPTVTTDASGYYVLSNMPAGTYQIRAQTDFCNTQTENLSVAGNETLDFFLGQKSDEFGYSCEALPAAYIPGDNLIPLASDDASALITLPFSFNFYGQTYDHANVATNGFLNFLAPDSTYFNTPIPSTTTPNAAIYPFWDDLYVDDEAGIYTKTIGFAPNRQFVIDWRNVYFFADPTRRLSFEIVLFEDGKILIQYFDVESATREQGTSATIGIENESGTIALQYSHEEASVINSLAVLYSPPPSVILVPQDYPTINQAMDIARFGDTILVSDGFYNETISVKPGVKLRSANPQGTLIDGGTSDVVVYIGGGSEISGFIIMNSGPDWWDAGIWITEGSPMISGNMVLGNSMGIVFYCSSSCSGQPHIENNIVFQNQANGILAHNAAPIILNNTIVANGNAGIAVDAAGTVLTNNISSQNGVVGIVGNYADVQADHNNVWNNPVNYSGITPGPNDMSADPEFVSPSVYNFHLKAGSPNIDTGSMVEGLVTDIDGEDRPYDGDGDGTSVVDIGADEYVGPPLLPPTAPSDLAAIGVTQQQIDLTWVDNSANENGFEIRRSLDGSEYAVIASVGNDVTSFSDTGLHPNTTHFYKVCAFNKAGSSCSDVVTGKTLSGVIPPSNLDATPISKSQIDLAWTDNSNNEDGFRIYRILDSNNGWEQVGEVGADYSSYSDNVLDSATTYYYRVCAFKGADEACSPVASGTTFDPPASNDQIAINEILLAGSLSGGYQDTTANDGVAEVIEEQESGGKPAKRYSYLEHKWVFDVQPGSSITFNANAWASASNDGDSFIFAYSVDDLSYTDMFTISANDDLDSYQTFLLPNSTSGTVYIRIVDTDRTAGNRSLDRASVDHLFIRTESAPGNPPTPPSDLTATAISASQIDLSWSDNSTDENGFQIERSLDGSTWESLGTTAADVTSYADKNLQADTSYTYRVLAYNASGSSGYSNTASATTQQASFLHVGDLDGTSSPANRGRWHATVSITVHDVNEQAVAGATVSGSWSGGASGSDTCVTDSNGLCNITKANIKSNVSNVLFTVTDITKDATVYQSTDNHDTDGDSDGTSITINQP